MLAPSPGFTLLKPTSNSQTLSCHPVKSLQTHLNLISGRCYPTHNLQMSTLIATLLCSQFEVISVFMFSVFSFQSLSASEVSGGEQHVIIVSLYLLHIKNFSTDKTADNRPDNWADLITGLQLWKKWLRSKPQYRTTFSNYLLYSSYHLALLWENQDSVIQLTKKKLWTFRNYKYVPVFFLFNLPW